MSDTTITETALDAAEPGICSECDGRIDEEGDTLEESNCPMESWHDGDCRTCGNVYCDRSC